MVDDPREVILQPNIIVSIVTPSTTWFFMVIYKPERLRFSLSRSMHSLDLSISFLCFLKNL